jgi:hypothetical protein
VLVAVAVEDAAEVTEMDDALGPTAGNGGDDTHPAFGVDANNVAIQGTGYFKRMNNFVGPKYGLPGYKESHNWAEDFDILSPLVFDYRYYRVLIKNTAIDVAQKMTEEDLKTHFTDQVQKESAPNCPQGTVWFNANWYKTMHSSYAEYSMAGDPVECNLIFKIYLTMGIFKGDHLSINKNDESEFVTVGTRIFNPVNTFYADADSPEPSALYYEVQSAKYVDVPLADGPRTDNSFTPARHLTMVYWLKIGDHPQAPNAELYGFGAKRNEHFLRTGVGCLSAAIDCPVEKDCYCYFIIVVDSTTGPKYFHSYDNPNFPKLRAALEGKKWAHVVQTLTTKNTDDCGNNSPSSDEACKAILTMHITDIDEGAAGTPKPIDLVDWADGADTTLAKTGWNDPVTDYWSDTDGEKRYGWSESDVVGRFWLSAPNSCPVTNQCGDVEKNGFMYEFPWFGAYNAGVYICDFGHFPSGVGGFGNENLRNEAIRAFYMVMLETQVIACSAHEAGAVSATANTHTASTDGNVGNGGTNP